MYLKNKMMSIKVIYMFNVLFAITIVSGCKKFVEVDGPKTSVNSKNVFNNDATAVGAITLLYVNLSNGTINSPGELTSLSCIASLSSDELNYTNYGDETLSAYYKNALTSGNVGRDYWTNIYQNLYTVNSAIEGLGTSTGLTPSVKTQLLGEAKFMRAFYYFYLVNLYGDVPLVLTTDYTFNSLVTKSPRLEVYKQITSDLLEAQNELNNFYVKGDGINTYPIGSEERIRPTKWAATALLSRVYLYNNDWLNAEKEAAKIIENKVLYDLTEINQVFLKNSKEAIWQLQPTYSRYNTSEANAFILNDDGPSTITPFYLNAELVSEFELNDKRRVNWIGDVTSNNIVYYYPYKYKVLVSTNADAQVTEYSTVMRLAEQVLIRAEARARQNNLSGAIGDLDQIRDRAGLGLIKDINPNISQDDLLTAIFKERKLELFTEWGHRWFDIKRSGKVDAIMQLVTQKKGNSMGWKSIQQYYPISLNELLSNPKLVQISGY